MDRVEKRKSGVWLFISAGLIVILTISNIIFFIYIQNLQRQLQSVHRQTGSFQSEKDDLLYQIQVKEQIIRSLQYDIADLEGQADANKFMFYYDSLTHRRYGVSDLEDCLNRWEWSEGTYRKGIFDCSEMSAYLEWKLENEGFHTRIISGSSPWGGKGHHAWLLVETSQGRYMPVEATWYDIVKWDNPYFDNYFKYDRKFETIQEALNYNYDEYDWWAS